MKIGILVTAFLSDEQVVRFGDLPSMFVALLSLQDEGVEYVTYNVCLDDFPSSPDVCDGWLITGSYHSAYERLPWMLKLEEFIRNALSSDVPMVGICFGHQIMAQAMGGVVAREANGKWGLAVHDYSLILNEGSRPSWMEGAASHFALQASHQDQVVVLPETAERIGGNDFCPNGLLLYGNTGLSMQLHPELSADFITTLISKRRGESMDDVDADDAASRVNDPVDDQLVARWIVNFLKESRA